MKKFIYYITGLCLLLGLSLFFAWHFLASDYIAAKITAECEKSLGSSPHFGKNPSLSIFPLAINLEQLTWNGQLNNYNFSFAAQRSKIEANLLPLLAGNIEINEILLDKPKLSLNALDTKKSSTGWTSANKKNFNIDIERIVLHDGFFELHNKANKIILEDIKLTADNSQSKKETELRCDFVIHVVQDNSKNTFDGNLACKSNIRYYAPNLTFRQTAASFTDLNGDPAFSPIQLAMEGAINLDTFHIHLNSSLLSSPFGKLKLNGDGEILTSSFKGETEFEVSSFQLTNWSGLGMPENLSMASPLTYSDNKLDFSKLAIKFGETAGSGNLQIVFQDKETPLQIKGQIKTGILNFVDSTQTNNQSQLNPRRTHPQSQKQTYPAININLNVEGINYKKIELRRMNAHLEGASGHYKLSLPGFDFCGGTVKAELASQLPEGKWNLTTQGEKIDFGNSLAAFGLEGFSKGTTSFNSNVSALGNNPDQITSTLTGEGVFEVQNTRMVILEYLSETFSFFHKNQIDYSGMNINAPFKISRGLMDVAPLNLKSNTLSANGQALIDLVKQSLNSKINFRLGKINLPLTFKGPFSHISVGLDSIF